ERHQRGIAAVAVSHDGDPRRIGDAGLDRPLDAVDEIVLHARAHLAHRGEGERTAIADRPAEVDEEHRITAIRQEMRAQQVLVVTEVGPHDTLPGTTVYEHHERQRPGAAHARAHEIGWN